MGKFFYYYLRFFYSFLIAVVFTILIFSQLHINPAPVSGLEDIVPAYRTNFIPQSYKLVYYSIVAVGIPFITILLFISSRRLIQKIIRLKRFFLIPLSLLSIEILSMSYYLILYYGRAIINEYYYIFKLDPIIFHPLQITAFLIGTFFFISLYFNRRLHPILSSALRTIYNYLPLVSIILIVITLFDRIIDEKYYFTGYPGAYLHTAPFIGSINDILMGKVILVDAYSQYGLLLPYFFAWIFKLIPLSIPNFFYLMVVVGIIYYVFAYLELKIFTKSNVWALIGLIVMFTLHFYSTFDRYTRPQVFPLRYLMDLPFFFLLLLYDNTPKKWLGYFLPFLAAVAFFYNLEAGTSIIISYLVYKSLHDFWLGKDNSLIVKGFNIFKSVLTIIIYIIILGFLYSLYAKFVSGKYPDWSSLMFYIRIFSKGFAGGDPPPVIGLHLITLAIYLIVLIKSCLSYIYKWNENNALWKISFAVYGLMIYMYYVKSPYILNLAIVSIPAIILMVNLFQELFHFSLKNRDSHAFSLSRLTIFAPYLILCSIVTFSITVYFFRIIVNHEHQYWPSIEADRYASEKIFNGINDASAYIKKRETSNNKVTVLSYYDAIILIKSGKTNALPLSNSQLVLTISQDVNLLQNLKKLNPQTVYTDTDALAYISYEANSAAKDKFFPLIFDYLQKNYRRSGTYGFLDVWEKSRI